MGCWYRWEHSSFASFNPRFDPGTVHQYYRRVGEYGRPRQSHKLEIGGSNPPSATNQFPDSTEVVALRC